MLFCRFYHHFSIEKKELDNFQRKEDFSKNKTKFSTFLTSDFFCCIKISHFDRNKNKLIKSNDEMTFLSSRNWLNDVHVIFVTVAMKRTTECSHFVNVPNAT